MSIIAGSGSFTGAAARITSVGLVMRGRLAASTAVVAGVGRHGHTGTGALAQRQSSFETIGGRVLGPRAMYAGDASVVGVGRRGSKAISAVLAGQGAAITALSHIGGRVKGPTSGTWAGTGAFRLNFKRATDYPPIVASAILVGGRLIPSFGHKVSGGTFTGLAKFKLGYKLRGQVISVSQNTGKFRVHTNLRGRTDSGCTVLGTLRYVAIYVLSQDQRTHDLGHRPTLIATSVADDIKTSTALRTGVVWHIDRGASFYVSTSYVPASGDGLFENGALPGYIGMRVLVDGVDQLRFRPPLKNESLYSLSNKTVVIWTGSAWAGHVTFPQRVLREQVSLEMFDPDGILDYYGMLLGCMMLQSQRDTEHLRDLPDPLHTPDEYVSYLAFSIGAEIDYEMNVNSKRETVRNYVPVQKLKGTTKSVSVAMQGLGFKGYITQIWIDPTNPATSPQERPIGYDNHIPVEGVPGTLFPSSRVALHVNLADDSTMITFRSGDVETIAAFLVKNVLPAACSIRWITSDVHAPSEVITIADSLVVTSL